MPAFARAAKSCTGRFRPSLCASAPLMSIFCLICNDGTSIFALATIVGLSLHFWSWCLCCELTAAACATVTSMHELRLLYHPPSQGGISFFLLRQYVTQRQGDNYAGSTYSTNSVEQNVESFGDFKASTALPQWLRAGVVATSLLM